MSLKTYLQVMGVSQMGRKHFFDYDIVDFVYANDMGNTMFSDDGHFLSKMGNNMVMDMDTGDIHLTSSLDSDVDNSFGFKSSLFDDDDD